MRVTQQAVREKAVVQMLIVAVQVWRIVSMVAVRHRSSVMGSSVHQASSVKSLRIVVDLVRAISVLAEHVSFQVLVSLAVILRRSILQEQSPDDRVRKDDHSSDVPAIICVFLEI